MKCRTNSLKAIQSALQYARLDGNSVCSSYIVSDGQYYEVYFGTLFVEYLFYVDCVSYEVMGFDSRPCELELSTEEEESKIA